MRSQHPELASPLKRCLGALATVPWPWPKTCEGVGITLGRRRARARSVRRVAASPRIFARCRSSRSESSVKK